MRFVLDECVDARVRTEFIRAGHQAWTIPSSGMAGTDDDEVAIYADSKGAVLVTEDRELIRRLRANLYMRVLDLRGQTPDGPEIVHAYVDEIVSLLEGADEVVVAANLVGCWIEAPPWLATPVP